MTFAVAMFVALAFLLGAATGGAVAWLVRGRRAPAEAGRFYTARIAAVTALATLIVVAGGGYLAIRVLFRSEPVEHASVHGAIEDFRRTGAAAERQNPANASSETPAAGVYTYRAKGFFHTEVPFLGTEHRDLGESVPAVLVPDGDCWDLTIRYFEQHRWTTRYCAGDDGALRVPSSRHENVHFGRTVNAITQCKPDVILPAGMSAGDTASLTCKSENDSGMGGPDQMTMEWTFVGTEELSIGDDKVQASHLRREVTMSGKQSGTATRDVWYAPSGLLLQLRNKMTSSGIADVEQDYHLTLSSLTPAK
jgi:hypothetical protein